MAQWKSVLVTHQWCWKGVNSREASKAFLLQEDVLFVLFSPFSWTFHESDVNNAVIGLLSLSGDQLLFSVLTWHFKPTASLKPTAICRTWAKLVQHIFLLIFFPEPSCRLNPNHPYSHCAWATPSHCSRNSQIFQWYWSMNQMDPSIKKEQLGLNNSTTPHTILNGTNYFFFVLL